MFEEIILGAIINAVIVGPIIAYLTSYLAKRMVKNTVKDLKNDLKTELEAWLNSEKGQKALYLVGGLVASGMKSGLGLQKTGGKMSLEGIIAQLVGNFLQAKIP